jgi:hypothetical protein
VIVVAEFRINNVKSDVVPHARHDKQSFYHRMQNLCPRDHLSAPLLDARVPGCAVDLRVAPFPCLIKLNQTPDSDICVNYTIIETRLCFLGVKVNSILQVLNTAKLGPSP